MSFVNRKEGSQDNQDSVEIDKSQENHSFTQTGPGWSATFIGPINYIRHHYYGYMDHPMIGQKYRVNVSQTVETKMKRGMPVQLSGIVGEDVWLINGVLELPPADVRCTMTRFYWHPESDLAQNPQLIKNPQLPTGNNYPQGMIDWRWMFMELWNENSVAEEKFFTSMYDENRIRMHIDHPWYQADLHQLSKSAGEQLKIEYPGDKLFVRVDKTANPHYQQIIRGDREVEVWEIDRKSTSREYVVSMDLLTEFGHPALRLMFDRTMQRKCLLWRDMGQPWQRGQNEF
jgi:hypothetical protein